MRLYGSGAGAGVGVVAGELPRVGYLFWSLKKESTTIKVKLCKKSKNVIQLTYTFIIKKNTKYNQ